MNDYKKPLPLLTKNSKAFYDACRAGKLMYQQCKECGEVVFFPKNICPGCLGHELAWKESSGKGRIYTYTVTRAFAPAEFKGDMPYVLAVINMDEGFSILSNIIDCNIDALSCEMPVQVQFVPVTSEITLPKFTPCESGG